MTPGCFDWPAQYAGDTAELQEIQIVEDGFPVDLTGATVRMQVRQGPGQPILISNTSVASSGIVISDATEGTFKVGGYENPDIEAALIYDIEVEFSNGDIRTYLTGSYLIYAQVTK